MDVLVVGLGSMGRRRVRLLRKYNLSVNIIGIDNREDRREQAEKELGIKTCRSIQDACLCYNVDRAFVSTAPLSHSQIISECLKRNLHVFSELNLSDDGYDNNIKLAKENNRVLFMSSTFLYRKEVQRIKTEVNECEGPLAYIYHAGQYLPDWHPWENFKDFFVGDKRTNGCREFMAIEFPWLIDTFGSIKWFYSTKTNNSTLDIDFPDTFQIIFLHDSGHRGIITIDVVSRKPVRNFELSGENLYLTWNGTPEGLKMYDYINNNEISINAYDSVERMSGYSSFVVENAYSSEIEEFFEVIDQKCSPRYSFEKDRYVLSVIDKIESFGGNTNDTE